MFGVVQTVDVVSGLGEKMRMTTLPAGNVQNLRIRGKFEHFQKARDFLSVALESEDRFVLEQIVSVKIGLPPFRFLSQKNTGSR